MEKLILDIFYNEILPSAAKDNFIEIDGWRFNVGFNTSFIENNSKLLENNNLETLIINDIDRFNEVLIEYTTTMLNHINEHQDLQNIDYIYYDSNINNIIKMILLSVWFNATVGDFKNPIDFLKLRKLLLEDKVAKDNLNCIFESKSISELNDSFVKSVITVQNPSSNETPYVFRTSIVNSLNEDDSYTLPNISFGIVDDTCYIYSIHGNKIKEYTPYEKKINRLLFKANKNFEDDYNEESIKDISLSQLFAMTIFLKFLNSYNIKHLVVKNYFPIRYNAKIMANQNRSEKLEKIKNNLTEEEYEVQKNNLNNDAESIQWNIINKYIRVIRRLVYHFDNLKVLSYPYEIDDSMHIDINNLITLDNEHILYDVYQSLDYNSNKKRYIKGLII